VNVTPGATGTFVLNFGEPAPGTLWWLIEVVVTGATDREAPVGAVTSLYTGPPARQVANTIQDAPMLGQLVRPAVALPAVFSFQEKTMPVKDGEELFAIVYSPTTAVTVLSAVATVMQIDARAVSINFLQ
jgi:hypothetical protein